MSHWTYVRGMITVAPMGRSVPEREYVLKAVLEHLPKVKGSERDMEILLTQPKGHDLYTSHDEFFEVIPRHDGRAHQQTKYILILHGNLRDTEFSETVCSLSRFLCRLSKRVSIQDILVKVDDGGFRGKYGNKLVISDATPYQDMFETPSWVWESKLKLPCYYPMYDDPDGNWCEYLMWDSFGESAYPKKLLKKLGYDVEGLPETLT